MDNCLFCRILRGEIPSTKVYEDEHVLVFKDIHPAAPVHDLVVPKLHVDSLEGLTPENMHILAPVHAAIRRTAEIEGIAESGYRVIVNCGAGAGQTVMHLHYHVLGGRPLGERLL